MHCFYRTALGLENIPVVIIMVIIMTSYAGRDTNEKMKQYDATVRDMMIHGGSLRNVVSV